MNVSTSSSTTILDKIHQNVTQMSLLLYNKPSVTLSKEPIIKNISWWLSPVILVQSQPGQIV
jgi:hypothetical protein